MGRFKFWYFWIAFSLIPIALGVVWGLFFDERTFVSFSFADNRAQVAVLGEMAPLNSPLYIGFLALAAWLGFPIAPTALVLSVLGWSVAIVAVLYLTRHVFRSWPAVVYLTALLLALNPVVLSTLGTHISWTVAGGALAMLSGVRKRWSYQTGALLIVLLLNLDLSAIVLALILLGIRWRVQRRFPLRSLLILTVVACGGAAAAIWQFEGPFAILDLNPAAWEWRFDQLLHESELYWLFLPLMAFGLPAVTRLGKWSWGWLVWGVAAWLGDELTGWAILSVAGLVLAGAGLDRIIDWLQRRDRTRWEPLVVGWWGVLILGLPLLVAETSSLWQRYQMRPRAYQQLESVAAAWLREQSEPDEVVLGSARIGFLAGRSVQVWSGGRGDEKDLPELVNSLMQSPPDYFISARTIAWDQLTRVPWFRERYRPMREFSSATTATSPIIVWETRHTPFDLGERRSAYVETPVGANLVGYQLWPQNIEPGGALYLSLFWQAARPTVEAFNSVVRIVSPLDGTAWAQRDEMLPRSIPAEWWLPDQIITERFVLTTTAEIPVGAYQVNVSVRKPWPIELLPLYQDHDVKALDRVLLGYVAVPWAEEALPEWTVPVGATFGDQIKLKSVAIGGDLMPGGGLMVTLYWEALRPPDADFVVFVHLIDEQDKALASHDGRPMEGRYTTLAWLPGQLVPDEHLIALPAELTAGPYRLRVGLYRSETGDRLPLTDSEGQELLGGFVILPIE